MSNQPENPIDPYTFFDETYFEGNTERPSNYLGGYTNMEYGKGHYYNWELDLVERHAPSGGMVIELGAATGTFGQAINNRWPDGKYSYFATDISRYALPQAKISASGLAYINMEEGALPFKSNCAKVVAAFDVLEHCRPEKATIEANIREIGRILEPGGLMLITLPLQGTWFKRLINVFGISEADPTHYQVPTTEMIESLLLSIQQEHTLLTKKYFFPLPKTKVPGIPSNVLIAFKK